MSDESLLRWREQPFIDFLACKEYLALVLSRLHSAAYSSWVEYTLWLLHR